MPDQTEGPFAANDCPEGHHWVTNMQGGQPLHVQICTLCHTINFDELAEQLQRLGVWTCPQCGKQPRSYSRGCSWCGFGRPASEPVDECGSGCNGGHAYDDACVLVPPAGTPSPAQLDALRLRIADPGAFLPRHFADGLPAEGLASWRARAVAAGLEDGTLGHVPATRSAQLMTALLQTAIDRDKAQAERDRLAVAAAQLAAAVDEHFGPPAGAGPIRKAADHVRQILDGVPAPVPGSSHARKSPEPADVDIEELSAAVHEGWMESKRQQGITSRLSESGEELMVPYVQLSEAAKELDRGTVRSVLAGIERAGYVVARTGVSQASEPARRPLSPASAVAVEVIAELARAEAKFPDQHLPDGTGGPVAQAIGALLKAMCQANGPGEDTWMAVIAEEVGESFAETEWAKLRPELVQVAAMAVRWVLDGDSRSAVTA